MGLDDSRNVLIDAGENSFFGDFAPPSFQFLFVASLDEAEGRVPRMLNIFCALLAADHKGHLAKSAFEDVANSIQIAFIEAPRHQEQGRTGNQRLVEIKECGCICIAHNRNESRSRYLRIDIAGAAESWVDRLTGVESAEQDSQSCRLLLAPGADPLKVLDRVRDAGAVDLHRGCAEVSSSRTRLLVGREVKEGIRGKAFLIATGISALLVAFIAAPPKFIVEIFEDDAAIAIVGHRPPGIEFAIRVLLSWDHSVKIVSLAMRRKQSGRCDPKRSMWP